MPTKRPGRAKFKSYSGLNRAINKAAGNSAMNSRLNKEAINEEIKESLESKIANDPVRMLMRKRSDKIVIKKKKTANSLNTESGEEPYAESDFEQRTEGGLRRR